MPCQCSDSMKLAKQLSSSRNTTNEAFRACVISYPSFQLAETRVKYLKLQDHRARTATIDVRLTISLL